MATFYSNKYEGRRLRLVVTQDKGYCKWTLYSEGGTDTYYTICNLKITINGKVVYNPGTVYWSDHIFPAKKGSKSGQVYIGNGASSKTIYVSFIGAVYYDRTTQNGGSFTMAAYITKPTLNALSSSNITDKSAKLSFSLKSANNGTISAKGIQISETNFGTVVKSASVYSGTFSGLTPYKTYYARGYATNEAGTTYTSVISFKTTFINPGFPGTPVLTFDKGEPVPSSELKASWVAASNGSTPVAGYRIRLYKNNTEIVLVDTESTGITYNFGVLEDLGVEAGDTIKVTLFAYCYDWNKAKHWSGNGTTAVASNIVAIISDKYIYVSIDGGAFVKYKIYKSEDGGAFVEVKKEKFKVIKE